MQYLVDEVTVIYSAKSDSDRKVIDARELARGHVLACPEP